MHICMYISSKSEIVSLLTLQNLSKYISELIPQLLFLIRKRKQNQISKTFFLLCRLLTSDGCSLLASVHCLRSIRPFGNEDDVTRQFPVFCNKSSTSLSSEIQKEIRSLSQIKIYKAVNGYQIILINTVFFLLTKRMIIWHIL